MNSVERTKQVCKERKIPISKLERDLGYSNGYISQLRKGVFPADRLEEIANYLSVSTTYLMTGEEHESELTARNERDIEKTLKETLDKLDSQDGLMFDGEALDDDTRELLRISIENAIRTAKIASKKKFTPKKYKE